MPSKNVNGVNSTQNQNNSSQNGQRPSKITVKVGEDLTKIAQRFGMSKAEFKKWTGISDSIQAGKVINLPVAQVETGKGIYALAREHNMTMAEFCKMNNISDPQSYSAKAGEVFYVKNANIKPKTAKKTQKTTVSQNDKNIKKSNKKTVQQYTKPENGAAAGAAIGAVVANVAIWGSSYTPKELSAKIFELSGKYWGAVGKPDFDALIDEINPKNASAVIEAYTKNIKNEDKESLIYTLATEIKSDKQARKDAIMKVYDALATEKGAPAEKREEFVKELNAQFDSWGMVSTKKLDSIIDEIMKIESAQAANKQSQSAVTTPKKPADNKAVTVPENKKYPNQTMETLRKSAISAGKQEAIEKFKEYCRSEGIKFDESLLDFGPMERYPYPNVNGSSITTYDSGLLKPTGKPNGKVIIINPGHGGYSKGMGNFDPGSYSFIKKANGKYAPLMEYDKMQSYKNEAVEKLRAQGYAVVVANGHAKTFSNEKAFSKIVNELNTGKKEGIKYDKKDIMFISLHADSEPGKKGSGICYDSRFGDDERLAKIMQSNLNEDDWITTELSERNWNVPKKGLQVLHQTEDIPSILLEVEYVNGTRCKNLDSSAYQTRFVDKMIEGINEYFGI